jgi:hypothetical protein
LVVVVVSLLKWELFCFIRETHDIHASKLELT